MSAKRKAKFRVGQKARIYGAKILGVVKLTKRIPGGFRYRTKYGIEGPVSENRLRRERKESAR